MSAADLLAGSEKSLLSVIEIVPPCFGWYTSWNFAAAAACVLRTWGEEIEPLSVSGSSTR